MLKQFMSESDSKMSSIRAYSDRKTKNQKKIIHFAPDAASRAGANLYKGLYAMKTRRHHRRLAAASAPRRCALFCAARRRASAFFYEKE